MVNFLRIKKNRLLERAISEGYKLAILDDGLQDPSIDCDFNIVCFNNINWIGNGLTIPSGPLRENIKNIKKYKNIFLNGNNENLEEIKKFILNVDPNINIHQGIYVAKNLSEFNLDDNFLVFSGIGNHETFISMLKINKFKIIKDIEFPDHYKYSKKDIDNIISISKELIVRLLQPRKISCD